MPESDRPDSNQATKLVKLGCLENLGFALFKKVFSNNERRRAREHNLKGQRRDKFLDYPLYQLV